MSSSRTPRYVVSLKADTLYPAVLVEWKTKVHGKITVENLKAFVKKYEESTHPGGCNEHLGAIKITSALVFDQTTKSTVLAMGE